jgi:fructose-1,6-bisphosphatase/inositol monophosphatase family enzyme
MYKYTKTIIKACEKASVNIARDLIEINHLHTSKNLGKFLASAQLRFERNITKELSVETNNISLYLPDGTEKSLQDLNLRSIKDSNYQATVIGIDNMVNFGHGIENIAFGISLDNNGSDKAIAICLPITNIILFSEINEEFLSLWPDGLTRKIKINQSTNINFLSVLCSSDHHNHNINQYLIKRDIHFISSGSILCDVVRILENKIDIAFFNKPAEVLLKFISYIVNGAGGADGFIGNSYVFGKKSLVKSAIQRASE